MASELNGGRIGGTAIRPVNIIPGDGGAIDAFQRFRTSEPYTLFDSKLIFDNNPIYWDDLEESGSGTSSTYTKATASVALGVSQSRSMSPQPLNSNTPVIITNCDFPGS